MSALAAGLRRTTPKTLKAQQFARSYQQPGANRVSRAAALKVAKLAAAAMGLKSSKIAMLDQLFACSKPADWTTDGVSPIVWPSNALLARKMGISVSTMKHHLNGLVQSGLVSFKDGPTYQRHGWRDDNGKIVEAHGIDLSPIAVRFSELSEMVEAFEYAAREWKRHSHRRTVLRKEIQSLILSAVKQGLDGPWSHTQARLDVIREMRPRELEGLMQQVADLAGLSDELQEIYDEMIQDRNFNAAVPKFRQIQTTAPTSNSESSNTKRSCAHAQQTNPMALEKEPSGEFPDEQGASASMATVEEDQQYLSLSLLKDACPIVEAFVPGSLDNWYALRSRGRDLCAAAGINPQVWQETSSTYKSRKPKWDLCRSQALIFGHSHSAAALANCISAARCSRWRKGRRLPSADRIPIRRRLISRHPGRSHSETGASWCERTRRSRRQMSIRSPMDSGAGHVTRGST